MRTATWTTAQVSILRTNYKDRSTEEIADIIGRSVKAIKAKAHELGLRKTYRKTTPRTTERKPIKRVRLQYINCIPNPFDTPYLRKMGFDINFYRKLV